MKGVILFFNFLILLFGFPAFAQETSGVKVQPAIIEERVEPGQIFSSALRITNLSLERKNFYIIKRNISGLSPTGSPIFAEEKEETGFEISSWIQIDSGPVGIGGGKTKAIPFSISVPKDASPGGHFGGIFVALTPERPKETGIGIGYQVGTIINLRISGEVFEEAQIREFRTDKSIYSKPEVTFITRVENIGNVLLRPRGPLEITDFLGKKVATLRVNDDGGAVLPKAIRGFETVWKGEGLSFGRYQAVMSLVYGEEGRKTITSFLSFWVLPLNIILTAIGIILGLILIIYLFVKFHIKRQLKQIREATENAIHRSRFANIEREILHHQKGAPLSRLMFVAVVILIFTLFLLIILFFLFA